jgi:hypothetical protein
MIPFSLRISMRVRAGQFVLYKYIKVGPAFPHPLAPDESPPQDALSAPPGIEIHKE